MLKRCCVSRVRTFGVTFLLITVSIFTTLAEAQNVAKPPIPVAESALPAFPGRAASVPPLDVRVPNDKPVMALNSGRSFACAAAWLPMPPDFLDCGKAKFAVGDYDEARRLLEQGANNGDSKAAIRTAQYWLGETYWKLSRFDDAAKSFWIASQDGSPTAIYPWALLGTGYSSLQTRDFARAREAFADALAVRIIVTSFEAWAHYGAGLASYGLDELASAERHFVEAKRSAPAELRLDVMLWLGETLLRRGLYRPAISAFEEFARAGHPLRHSALFGLGYARIELSEDHAGLTHLRTFLKEDSNNERTPAGNARRRLAEAAIAMALLRLGQLDESLLIIRALRSHGFPSLDIMLTNVFAEVGGTPSGGQAEFLLRQITVDSLPSDLQAWIRLREGDLYRARGATQNARQRYTAVLMSRAPAEYRSCAELRLAHLDFAQKDYTSTIRALSSIDMIAEPHARYAALVLRGESAYALSDFSRAVSDYRQALRIRAELPLRLSLAWAEARRANVPDARRLILAAIKDHPADGDVFDALAMLSAIGAFHDAGGAKDLEELMTIRAAAGSIHAFVQKLAKTDNRYAQYYLARSYDEGFGGATPDQGEALKWYRRAADNGHGEAQVALGLRFEYGRGTEKDPAEALRWYQRAANGGSAEGQFLLGVKHYLGEGVKRDPSEAVKWYRRAADQNHSEAQYLLGRCYQSGEGVARDDSEAMQWIRRSADQGLAAAQYALGHVYNAGRGVRADQSEAAKWFRKAAEGEDLRAQAALGHFYVTGRGGLNDPAEGAKWYRKAADRGDIFALYNLAMLYLDGQGVSKNETEAAELLLRAAERGDPDAQEMLGRLFEDGRGVAKSGTDAAKWYNLAANQGQESAQIALGVLYFRGDGVLQDYAEGVRWFRKAADLRNGDAQRRLAHAYRQGWGVTQDLVLAHMWYNLAASHSSGTFREEITKDREDVARLLTPARLAKAQQLAREWVPGGKVIAKERRDPIASQREPQREPGHSLRVTSTGSGFFVNRSGMILTNAHVVNGCGVVRVKLGSAPEQQVEVAAVDRQNDLALLKSAGAAPASGVFRTGKPIRQGELVVAVGFPLRGVLASDANVTSGNVSALAGIRDDIRYLQISAPIQPGNSGGPLVDEQGNVVGVIVSKLNAVAVASATGDIPQNVNFALNASVARTFLDAKQVVYETSSGMRKLEVPDIGEQAKRFTVAIECLK